MTTIYECDNCGVTSTKEKQIINIFGTSHLCRSCAKKYIKKREALGKITDASYDALTKEFGLR